MEFLNRHRKFTVWVLLCSIPIFHAAKAVSAPVATQQKSATGQSETPDPLAATMLQEAHALIYSKELEKRLSYSSRIEVLKAKCAILRYSSQPRQSLKEARELKEPFYASLALGGIAAILQKTDPAESEKLFVEAEQIALKITHWTSEDATSIGYLYRLIPGYDNQRAQQLWAKAAPALIKWDSSSYRSYKAMRELSLVTLQVNPDAAETFWQTYIPYNKNHYWESAEILARAIVNQSPTASRKKVEEWLARGASNHNVTAFRRALLEESAPRDLPATMKWIQSMNESVRLDSAFDLTMVLLYMGQNSKARQVLDYFEDEAKAVAAKGGDNNRGAMWLSNAIPQLREVIISRAARPQTTTIATGDTLDVIFKGGGVPLVTPEVIETFLENPQIQRNQMFGGLDILEAPRIQLKDDDQAARLISAALPLIEKIRDGGYPHHGSPRSQAFGTLALIEAKRGNLQQAHELINRIDIPELKAFYLLEAVQISNPLPTAASGWPLDFWQPADIAIGFPA